MSKNCEQTLKTLMESDNLLLMHFTLLLQAFSLVVVVFFKAILHNFVSHLAKMLFPSGFDCLFPSGIVRLNPCYPFNSHSSNAIHIMHTFY